jgi:4,5-dihydroxyphthalate decarboxylase
MGALGSIKNRYAGLHPKDCLTMSEITRRSFFGTAGSLAGASVLGIPTFAGTPQGVAEPAVTLAITAYLRFTPLLAGEIQGREPRVRLERGSRREMLDRTLDDPDVDGGEGSMLGHLLRVDRGDRSMVAVPVFLLRNFTARDLYTLDGSGLKPQDLNGRRLGIYNWAASGAVWYRHLLRFLGCDPTSMEWIVGGTDAPAAVTSRAPLPSHVRDAPPGRSLTDLLQEGEIDALFTPLPPAAYHRVDGPLVRVIPEYPSLEKQYFRETGFYPPQHVLLMKRAAWERDPQVGFGLLETFQECEEVFIRGQRLYPYGSPWMIREVEDTELLMGLDYHAHGLVKNHAAVDAFCQAAFDDGLTARRVTVEEYFQEFLGAR